MMTELEDLYRKQAAIAAEIEHKKEETKLRLRSTVEKLLTDGGFDLSDIFPDLIDRRKVRKSRGLYQDPTNEENTWGGRGRKPQWLVDKLAHGARLDDFKIAS